MLDVKALQAIFPQAGARAQVFLAPLNATMERYAITSLNRAAYFLAQAGHESAQLTHLEENLNYSAGRLLQVFPTHFNAAQAAQYAHQPQKIADRVYANRMGNRDEASGDGWKYRGRAIFQCTGAAEYARCGKAMRLDLVNHPELLIVPANAVEAAGSFWNYNKLNHLADQGLFTAITKRINGGTAGLDQRQALRDRALVVLKPYYA